MLSMTSVTTTMTTVSVWPPAPNRHSRATSSVYSDERKQVTGGTNDPPRPGSRPALSPRGRYAGGVEARPAGPLAYAPDRHGTQARCQRDRLKSLQEHIDTTTPGGKLIFHVFGALAEFERDLIGERTKAGLSAARARGRKGGRKPALTQKQIALAKSMKADRHNSIADICTTLKISKRTLYRYTGERHAETERR
jgi:hypothetical protein